MPEYLEDVWGSTRIITIIGEDETDFTAPLATGNAATALCVCHCYLKLCSSASITPPLGSQHKLQLRTGKGFTFVLDVKILIRTFAFGAENKQRMPLLSAINFLEFAVRWDTILVGNSSVRFGLIWCPLASFCEAE